MTLTGIIAKTQITLAKSGVRNLDVSLIRIVLSIW